MHWYLLDLWEGKWPWSCFCRSNLKVLDFKGNLVQIERRIPSTHTGTPVTSFASVVTSLKPNIFSAMFLNWVFYEQHNLYDKLQCSSLLFSKVLPNTFTIQGMHSNSYEEMQRISSGTHLFLFGTRLTKSECWRLKFWVWWNVLVRPFNL